MKGLAAQNFSWGMALPSTRKELPWQDIRKQPEAQESSTLGTKGLLCTSHGTGKGCAHPGSLYFRKPLLASVRARAPCRRDSWWRTALLTCPSLGRSWDEQQARCCSVPRSGCSSRGGEHTESRQPGAGSSRRWGERSRSTEQQPGRNPLPASPV